jgi:hypothetical protein
MYGRFLHPKKNTHRFKKGGDKLGGIQEEKKNHHHTITTPLLHLTVVDSNNNRGDANQKKR